jgi:uncharacterized protein involved in response to NO
MNAVPRVPVGYDKYPLLSYGFRPFFLGAAVWAVCALALWILLFFGELSLPTALSPVDWHVHEMLYGYLAAVVAGFLLTAIPNWTGRLPVAGPPLAALVGLWVAGRLAIGISSYLGAVSAAAIDVLFLVALAAVCLREIIVGKNWRNLRVIGVLSVLLAGNIVFHVEAAIWGTAPYGSRIGIAAAIGLITLIGGRIVPSFTRNWLARQGEGRLPQPFSHYDRVALGVGAAALLLWVAEPMSPLTGAALVLAGVIHAGRLVRWAGDRTAADRLVLVLHVGYAFVPLGFLLVGASAAWPQLLPMSAGIHAWTAGAIAVMTLAVMTRATLGHTGRDLAASAGTQIVYALAVSAALLRVLASFVASVSLLEAASLAWLAAFGGFLMIYGPMLLRSKVSPRAARGSA